MYRALDHAVAELLRAAGGDQVEVTIVTDHGSGGASDKVLYCTRVLQDAGFLRFRAAVGGPCCMLVRLAQPLACVATLPPHPVSMTAAAVPQEWVRELALPDNSVRIAFGFEDIADLIEDLQQALD